MCEIFFDFVIIVVFVIGMSVREEIFWGIFIEVGFVGKFFIWCEYVL